MIPLIHLNELLQDREPAAVKMMPAHALHVHNDDPLRRDPLAPLVDVNVVPQQLFSPKGDRLRDVGGADPRADREV